MPSSPLPVFHLDTAPLPQGEQFPAWAATMIAFDVSQPLPGTGFVAAGSAWQVGSLVVSEQSLGLATFARSAAKIRADGADHYSIIFVLDGAWDGQLGRRTVKACTGDLCVIDLGQPLSVTGAAHSITVLIRRDMLDEALPPFDMHGLMPTGAVTELFKDHLHALVRRLPEVTQSEAAAVARATRDLLAASLEAGRKAAYGQNAAVPAALLNRAKRYIGSHLTEALTAETICAALAISRTMLYRVCEPMGGVAAYVQHRRLTRVHELLAVAGENRTITELAQAFGFTSKAHFSRSFKREFGYTAAEFRASAIVNAGPAVKLSSPDTYRAWTKKMD